MKSAMIALVTAAGMYAQGTVQGPVLGWVYDSSSLSVRTVLGIPGASLFGESQEAERAVVAAGRSYGIVLAGEERKPAVIDFAKRSRRELELPTGADSVVFSSGGAFAAIVYGSRAAAVSGLPDGARLERIVDLGEGQIAAVSDEGSMLVIGGDALMAMARDGNQWKIELEGAVRSAALVDGTSDAVVATASGLYLVRDVFGTADTRKLWSGGARVAAANRRYAAVLQDSGGLSVIQLESGEVRDVECACAPTMLARLSESVYRVNEMSDGPLWLLDLNGQEPRTVFVPAGQKSEQ